MSEQIAKTDEQFKQEIIDTTKCGINCICDTYYETFQNKCCAVWRKENGYPALSDKLTKK